MNAIKRLLKRKAILVWSIVTAVALTLTIVVDVLAFSVYDNAISLVLGGRRAVYEEGQEAIYTTETLSKEHAKENAELLTEELCEEGITLLRNEDNALPLSSGARVSVFGKNSVDLVYGGSGSGEADTSEHKTLYESLEKAGFVYNPVLKEFYENDSLSGDPRPENSSDLDSGGTLTDVPTGESDYDRYTQSVKESYAQYSDAALIVISRISGEGFDLPRTSASGRHYLELDENEQELIRNVTSAGFDKVILIVNSASVMELGFVETGEYGDIDACLLMSGPGSTGVMALGSILNGNVNPSGHTVDTYASDLTADPTFVNFGDCNIEDGDRYLFSDGTKGSYYYVDYEEGIYVGYRYYETRGYTDGEEWYKENVVYPFGYGLSYTEFSYETIASDIEGVTIGDQDKNETYTVTVRVANSESGVAGKAVVQVYASAPYLEGGIEKAHKVLVGFVKTGMIEPGESEEVTISFTPYDFASYDCYDSNENAHSGYELDGGDYKLYIGTNARDAFDEVDFSVESAGVTYDVDPDTGSSVQNRFEDADDQLGTTLSRSDWEGTMPASRTVEERTYTEELKETLDNKKTNNPNVYEEMPETGVSLVAVDEETGEETDGTILLREMAEEGYDSEKWNAFISQLTVDEMYNLTQEGAFQTLDILRLGIPKTIEADGPVGFVAAMDKSSVYGTNAYCCEVMVGSTWSTELARRMGESIADEAYWGDQKNGGTPYSGLYAPGANIHRSPFCGRNFEYFSEDPLLSGEMAAAEVSGAAENGVAMFMKHFAMNEQETHRSLTGLSVWATEQSMRELYFKPFEIAVKTDNLHGVMSSFTRIGTTWCGGDYRLLTSVLRDEWGFNGTVISDFIVNDYCDVEQMLYAGGDLNLSVTKYWRNFDASDASDVNIIMNAAKNILYTVSRTNAVNGVPIGYKMPIWQIVTIAVECVIGVGLVIWGVIVFRKQRKGGEETEIFVRSDISGE